MDKEFVQTGRRWQSTPRYKPLRQWIGAACNLIEQLQSEINSYRTRQKIMQKQIEQLQDEKKQLETGS